MVPGPEIPTNFFWNFNPDNQEWEIVKAMPEGTTCRSIENALAPRPRQRRRIKPGERHKCQSEHHKIYYAAFGADRPTSEPARAVKTGIQKVPLSQ